MQLSNIDFYLLFCASFFLTSLLTPVVRIFALKYGVTDIPNQTHKTHKEPIPYLGGVAIVVGTTATIFGSALLTNSTRHTLLLASTILLPAILMSIIGIIDDIRQLKPWPRFIAQNTLALISATILVKTDTLGTPFGVLPLDFAATMLWLVGITNSINFFDNIDGGASGAVAISSLALTFIAINNGQILIGAMSGVLAGSTIGFLIWNRSPARIYMGDAGALFLGILIATLAIRLDSKEELGKLGVLIPFFLLAVPILDTSVAVVKRAHRRISLFQGGKDHLSHRLMRLGFRKQIAVLILWFLSAIFSILSIVLSKNYSRDAVIAFGGFMWILLFIFFLSTKDEN